MVFANMDPENHQVTTYPSEVLAEPARPLGDIGPEIRQVVERMTEMMLASGGVGLAGPQAGVPLRIFIISLECRRDEVKVYINPEVEFGGAAVASDEGCLSVPGVTARIKRYQRCTVTATDLEGRRFTESADGLMARAIQHEMDHLNGITIIQRMGQAARITHRKTLKKLRECANGL
jgi:peptide deformylase